MERMEEFVQDSKELKERLVSAIKDLEYIEEIDETTEVGNSAGVLFTINLKGDLAVFNFGDRSYECNKEFLDGLEALFIKKEEEMNKQM